MRVNEHTALSTSRVRLVPYSTHHVSTYHAWMRDAALRAATASEPLTLEEEYAMRRAWRADGDKLSFIVCLPQAAEEEREGEERMVGDVNVFLAPVDLGDEDEDGHGGGGGDAGQQLSPPDQKTKPEPAVELSGEINLMIALPIHRGQGHGRSTLLTLMTYVLRHWDEIVAEYSTATTPSGSSPTAPPQLAHFVARINHTNTSSISLFESVGFERRGPANYFGEVEMRWLGGADDLRRCKGWEEVREEGYG